MKNLFDPPVFAAFFRSDPNGVNQSKSCSMIQDQGRIKAVFIGDSGVGKTSLYSRLESNTYDEDHLPTIGGAFAKISIPTRTGANYDVGLWDTAGQERYRDIIPMYFEHANFILAVYAVNDRASFDHLSSWIACARARADETVKVIVLGNKCDVTAGREVTVDEMMQYVATTGASLGIETSAKSSAGLDLLLQGIEAGWRDTLAIRLNTKGASGGTGGIQLRRAEPKKSECC
jgi:small GTP-binding protein